MFRFLMGSILLVAVNVHASHLFSGYSQSDITPTAEEGLSSCLGGYGLPYSRCGITESLDPITVSSLYLGNNKNQIFIVSLDTVGLGDSLIADIKNSVVNVAGTKINPNTILVSATHTHSGPDLQGLWGGVSVDYRARVIRAASKAIVDAYNTRSPAEIYTWSAKSSVENRRGWNIVDDSINILDIRSKKNKKRIATLINMSAHPTVIDATNKAWSSDFVGYLRNQVEWSLHTRAIFVNGIVGDAQPATNGERGVDVAKVFASDVSKEIVAASKKARELDASEISYAETDFTQQIENPMILLALKMGILDLDVSETKSVTSQLGVISIGCDFKAIVFPGEALSRLGIPMKDSLKSRYKMFFGLTGDTLGYFIPQDEFGVIQGRSTEENASLSKSIGDSVLQKYPEINESSCDAGGHHHPRCNLRVK